MSNSDTGDFIADMQKKVREYYDRQAERAERGEIDVSPCYVCGKPGVLAGSLGSLCPEHYDSEERGL